jgi:hypothetical protein
VNRTRFVTLMAVLGGALVALVAVVTLVLPESGDAALPEPLEEVFPLPDDVVVRQTVIQIDLPIGYEVTLTVDGTPIPDYEIGRIEETGLFTWQPGPGSIFEMWEPGDHTVTVVWDRIEGGRPDPGEFTWGFRVT